MGLDARLVRLPLWDFLLRKNFERATVWSQFAISREPKSITRSWRALFYVSFYPPIFLRDTPALRADHSSLGFFTPHSLTLLSSCFAHRLLSKVSQPEGTSPDFPKQSDFLISSGELEKDGDKAYRALVLLCLVE